jgi:catechol 2,3-dioxygenase-like lactoylglutathione lyase family enzyme
LEATTRSDTVNRVRVTGINHVSIPAVDVDETMRFYQEIFGMERIPSPNFGGRVRWLRVGDLQLHIFSVSEQAGRTYQHLGIEVDDFEAAYLKLRELDAFEEGSRFRYLFELPSGEVQMYFRDPSDNLVEIDWPDVTTLDRSLFGDDLKRLDDFFPQAGENLRATLFLRLREQATA